MQRREFTLLFSMATVTSILVPAKSLASTVSQSNETNIPVQLPANILAMIKNVLATDCKSINTDWFGSIQIEGLLRFAKRGIPAGKTFAEDWFAYHLAHDRTLSDDEYYKQYEGNKARIMREGPLTFALYSANLGVAFPVHELHLLNKDQDSREVCINVADAILHYAARDRFGMLAHDDFNFTEFAIPDTAYWATRANAIAAVLSTSKEVADVYWKQSIYQLEQGITYFLDKEKGLVRTGLFKGEFGKTYWCRSQGWLLWAIAGLLRYLPKTHPKFNGFAADMELIAKGLQKHQSPNGALRVLVDDPTSPEEVTGTCMALSALKEATRKGWISNTYQGFLDKSWKFVQQSVDEKGNIHHAYTGWAVPAEKKQTRLMDERVMGYIPGIVMLAADEMTR
jgi:rhamnogalacturonyl hydrolase YesR